MTCRTGEKSNQSERFQRRSSRRRQPIYLGGSVIEKLVFSHTQFVLDPIGSPASIQHLAILTLRGGKTDTIKQEHPTGQKREIPPGLAAHAPGRKKLPSKSNGKWSRKGGSVCVMSQMGPGGPAAKCKSLGEKRNRNPLGKKETPRTTPVGPIKDDSKTRDG